MSEQLQARAEDVAHAAGAAGWTVATAESLTSGRVATELGKAPEAAEWFRGAVVAYGSEVKYGALGVPEGPVITRTAALEMARGASRLLGADVVVSLTGAGGPGPEEGQEAGTVWFACVWPGGEHSSCQVFEGDPSEIVETSTLYALETLVAALERSAAAGEGTDRTG